MESIQVKCGITSPRRFLFFTILPYPPQSNLGRQGYDRSNQRDLHGQLRRAAADQRAGRGVGGGSSLGGCVSVDVGGARSMRLRSSSEVSLFTVATGRGVPGPCPPPRPRIRNRGKYWAISVPVPDLEIGVNIGPVPVPDGSPKPLGDPWGLHHSSNVLQKNHLIIH